MSLTEILAIVSPLATGFFSILTWRRGAKNDDTATAREMATLTGEVKHNTEKIDRNTERIEGKLEGKVEKLEARVVTLEVRANLTEREE